ncbi:MAG: sigma-70 family RNA polymerase sigma factor [Clostridia bacterium]|nr:sigma-70 family RNA polymerase sigma factor [Clostridia bacterium]
MENYRRYLSGDESAFDALIRQYRHSLTFFLMRYVKDPATAEELAIDVFAELVLHPRRYNFKVSLKTYLFMIGRSRAIDYLRRQKRNEPLAEDLSYEEQFFSNEQKRALHTALSALPEEMQEAVYLVYFEELSYKEAAGVLKKTPKQVDNLLYRAKGLLRKELEHENG